MSAIKTYVKKPVKIQAAPYKYPLSGELKAWLGKNAGKETPGQLRITTLEDGTGVENQVDHIASEGDMIIKGVDGEFYPCKPDIFKKTYFDSKD
jgi:hypothetical protein